MKYPHFAYTGPNQRAFGSAMPPNHSKQPKGWPWPVFRLERAKLHFVFRSKKAQNSLYITFGYKIFRELRWFRNEIRENSQKYPASPPGDLKKGHEGKVENGASRITKTQVRFKRPKARNLREVFINIARIFSVVQNGINFAQKEINFAYFMKKSFLKYPQ
jgi:hypothetical protein